MGQILDMELLRTFLEVSQCGGFTRTGLRLHKAQSTVSLHVKRLEAAVGKLLFERQGKRVRLTEEGETLAIYARKILDLAREAGERINRPLPVGAVRIGIPEDFAGRQLPFVLRQFAARYPAVRVEVTSAVSSELLRGLTNGALDLALARCQRKDGSSAVWQEPLVWVGARDFTLEKQRPLPLVMFPNGCLYRPLVLERLRKSAIPSKIVYTSTSLAGVQAAVLAGLGITVLAESNVLREFKVLTKQNGLPPLPTTRISIYWGKGQRSEAAIEMAEFIRTSLAKRPDLVA